MLRIGLIYLETEAMFKVHSCTNHPDVTPEIQRRYAYAMHVYTYRERGGERARERERDAYMHTHTQTHTHTHTYIHIHSAVLVQIHTHTLYVDMQYIGYNLRYMAHDHPQTESE